MLSTVLTRPRRQALGPPYRRRDERKRGYLPTEAMASLENSCTSRSSVA